MPRNYICKRKPYTEEQLQEALRLIKEEKLSLRRAATKYKIDKSLLSRRLNQKKLSKRGRKVTLSESMEKDLKEKIITMAKWGFAITKEEVKLTVQSYVVQNCITNPFKDGKPGDDWFRNFCARNNLSQKRMEPLEKCRRTATSDPFLIYGFYDRVQEAINNLNLYDKPSNIWNLDETSFSSDPSRIKGVAAKGQKVYRNIEGSGKENTTTMACISAAGILLPPLIIFQGKNLWSTWKGEKDLPGTCYATSENGWMTTVIFQEWFTKFCKTVVQRPLLVIMDGHVTHLSKDTIEFAIQENITLLKLPAHTTDTLQPLDKCCFGPLKLKWNQKLIEWQRLNQRKPSKNDFSDLLCEVWHDGITETTIKSAFNSTGIYPCNKDKYPIDRLDPEKLTEYKRYQNEKRLQVPANNIIREEGNGSAMEEVICNENGTMPSTSEGVSFETILLSKINRTNSRKNPRRKIDNGAKILTSEEFQKIVEEKCLKKS